MTGGLVDWRIRESGYQKTREQGIGRAENQENRELVDWKIGKSEIWKLGTWVEDEYLPNQPNDQFSNQLIK